MKNTTSNVRQISEKPPKEQENSTNSLSSLIAAAQERRSAYDELLNSEEVNFERSRRHLANMMGEDPENFTQEDINRSIKYLFPSGLFDQAARPMLSHPKDYYPLQKAAQFDNDGRPFHCLFFTGKPNYFNIMHEAGDWLHNVISKEDSMRLKGESIEGVPKLDIARSEWLDKLAMEKIVLEKLKDVEYVRLINLLERILRQPLAIEAQEFIMRFRKKIEAVLSKEIIEPLRKDETGRLYSSGSGTRKSSTATVVLRDQGSGKIMINGHEFLKHFNRFVIGKKSCFLSTLPICFIGLMWIVRQKEAPSGQAGAIRLAISKALRSFVDEPFIEKMRQAGLLTVDPRSKERKKPGQKRARKKFTWKKR
ncbi:putative 28S ribosomal protein S9, mitochondrial isoform X1 [Apostichopus japonicus]|uniref:Putative 28S ribosomal protein S9, mitochondrial isoform X1 n=1 Tax=Stichopus japonicus TaxID=307972 RepID=A0A2G8KA41_STIJA|nr:putative 28S ribosomal protein S9, mitochondrial isoform X1 [Apostichopus japonicus]